MENDFKLLEEIASGATQKRIEGPSVSEVKTEETHESFKKAAEETLKEEAKAEAGSSIFDQLKKTTEEDEFIQPKGLDEKVTEIAKDITSGSSEVDSFTECKIKAESHIALIDVGFSVVACFLLKDFSDSVYQKFSLSSDRRKVLIQAMARLYQQMKIKSNPKVEVALLILGSYIPLIWLLFMTKKKRMEEALNPVPQQPAYIPTSSPVPDIPIPTGNQYYDQMGSVNDKKRGVKPGSKRGPYKK